MSSRRNKKERREALGGIGEPSSLQESTDAIYRPDDDEDARPMELRTGRIVARPIDLNEIRPHRAQPRRPIPKDVMGKWDGDPDEIDDILLSFHGRAEMEYGNKIDVAAVLQGRAKKWAIPDEDSNEMPVFTRYANLIMLAQNILSDGLTNPITVYKSRYGYQIETGERRWWAFQILARYVSEKEWGKIPAREVEFDPFRQASENNARSDLNAISMARQVAVLIMALLHDKFDYTPIDDMILPGENDRRFYAQVANGYVHTVSEAFQRRIQKAVKGLSWSRISQYRSLLALVGNDVVDDAIWLAADEYGWTESLLRGLSIPRDWDEKHKKEYVLSLERTVQNYDWDYEDLIRVRNFTSESFTTVKLREEQAKREASQASDSQGEATPVDKSQWASYAWVGKEVWAGPQRVFVTDCKAPGTVIATYEKDGQVVEAEFGIGVLFDHAPPIRQSQPEATGDSDNVNHQPDGGDVTLSGLMDKNGVEIKLHDRVKTRTNHEGKVVNFNGRLIDVEIPGNYYAGGSHFPQTLEVLSPLDSQGEAADTWVDKIVQTVVGAVAKVVEDNGEKVGKSDYPDVLTPETIIRKRVTVDGEKPAVVVSKFDDEHVWAQVGNEREKVHISRIVLYQTTDDDTEDDDELLSIEDDVTGTPIPQPLPQGIRQGEQSELILNKDDEVYKLIGTLNYLAELFGDGAAQHHFKRLKQATLDTPDLTKLFDTCYTCIEDVVNEMLARVGSRFDAIAGNGDWDE